VLEVRVDRALGDAKLLCDVTVGHSLADQRRDLPLPAGQQAGRALAARCGRQFVGVRHHDRNHEVERAAGAIAEQRRVAVLAERLLSMSEGGAMASQPGDRRGIVSQCTTTIRLLGATGVTPGPRRIWI